MRTHLLLGTVALGIIGGIGAAGSILTNWLSPVLVTISVCGLGTAMVLHAKRTLLLWLTLGFVLAGLRVSTIPRQSEIVLSAPTTVTSIGSITDVVQQSTRNGYRVHGQLQLGTTLQSGDVLVWDTMHWPPLPLGTRVRAVATVAPNTEASYAHWLQLQGITIHGRAKYIEVLGITPVSWWQQQLHDSRQWVQRQSAAIFGEPAASLLVGLLTGDRSRIPATVTDVFRICGLTHLLAVSGGNVAMIIVVANIFLWWLPVRFRLIPIVLAITWFAFFTGLSASVIRASIMSAIATLALCSARTNSGWRSIVIAAAAMVLYQPQVMWWDIGFQLSFLSVLGLLSFGTFLQKRLTFVPEKLGLRESLAMTLAAQLGTEACVIYHFGQVSLISPLANMFVTPLIPLVSIAGGLSIALSTVSSSLALMAAVPTQLVITWIIFITNVLSQLPYATTTAQINIVTVCFTYGLVLGFAVYVQRSCTNS